MNHQRIMFVMLLILLLCSCVGGDNDAEAPALMTLKPQPFAVIVEAEGEIRAVKETPINVPRSGGPRSIAWLAPNNSWVEAGEVVVRFDDTKVNREIRELGISLEALGIQVEDRYREMGRMLAELSGQQALLGIEQSMADQFNVDNQQVYSRQEIIDAQRDEVLLDFRAGHLEQKREDQQARQSAEVAVLDAQRSGVRSQRSRNEQELSASSATAPHAGYLTLDRNWYGEPISVGSTAFPGNKVASIPDLDEMEARLHVLESDALGLQEGQTAEVVLDAYPDQPVQGSVSKISASAAPIDRESPVKYFRVTVKLEKADPKWIQPGARATARIQVHQTEQALSIPNQTLYQNDSGYYVFTWAQGKARQQAVSLGMRGPNRTEITDGLKAGDQILLGEPPADTETAVAAR